MRGVLYLATCVLILAWSFGSWAQSLSYLEPTGQGKLGVLDACDDCSSRVDIEPPFPFGDYCHDRCYVGVNGVISFDKEFGLFSPEFFPGSLSSTFYAYLVAPFWADADLRAQGNITWEIHTMGMSETGDAYLNQVSGFIENRENVTFEGNWMMMVDYDEVPPYHAFAVFAEFFPNLTLPTNSYQAILITDGTNSYAVYTYTCGEMEWGSSAVIGFNAAGNYFENHNSSGVPTVSRIACLALPEQVNNLVYDLVPEPKNFQCSSPPEPPSSLGTCKAAGYNTCCSLGVDSCAGEPHDCFCDPTCHLYVDCCRDIDEICPQGNFSSIDGNETYLLFANSFHINRVTLDGSSFEILYTNTSSGGIVGLDYHHSQDYMYWSDTRSGTLNRAHLNGSNPEVLIHTDDISVDDIAVDWITNKLYWTEATLSEILVMDVETRRKTRLISNNNRQSTTRAIAVDPTTRYMYWSDWGFEARIERAGMDGSNRNVLHNTNLVWPNGITLDYVNQKIYWIDASLDTIEYSNVDGTERTLLERVDDGVFHPFSLTLAKEFLFWTDWNQLAIFSTHKNLPNDNIISLFSLLVDAPHGIEAVTPDRQQDAPNPCTNANCSSLCLLSPDSTEYTCVCADDDDDEADCVDPPAMSVPTTLPFTFGSCIIAGYRDCCMIGSCRGIELLTGEPSSCMCDALCAELGTCCDDIVATCPLVRQTCHLAGYTECCPAGAGCTDTFSHCSCDANCFKNNNCCIDALYFCQNVPTTSSPSPTPTSATTPSSHPTAPSASPTAPSTSPTTPSVTEIPGSVINVEVANLSSSKLRVNWTAPESGGPVHSYRVTVSTATEDNIIMTDNVFINIINLSPEVPYYVSVEAVNSLGSGDAQSIIAFTREGSPSVAPMVTMQWTSLTDLQVSWVPLTLEEARGFIKSYIVIYSSDDQRKKRDHESSREVVLGDQSSVTLDGLDSNRQYSVSIAAETAAGTGVRSDPLSAPSAGLLFQLHLLDVSSCEEWQKKQVKIVSQIITELVVSVKILCSECHLQAADVTNSEIQCGKDPNSAIFRALLLGDVQHNQDILNGIKKWVEQGTIVTLDRETVKLNSDCEVSIESFQDIICTIEATLQPSPTEPLSRAGQSNIASSVAPLVIIFAVVIVISILVVVILYMRQRKQKERLYANFEEHEATGTARLSQNAYEEDKREFDNPIYKEKAPDGEYFEDPNILK